jgi:hypothetical protein
MTRDLSPDAFPWRMESEPVYHDRCGTIHTFGNCPEDDVCCSNHNAGPLCSSTMNPCCERCPEAATSIAVTLPEGES